MASMELNSQVKTISDTFFSKDNISAINKRLLEKNNLNEINKEGKKKIIDLLIKNMKSVYKSIDLKKINKKNFDSIFQQFNKLSYDETQKELRSNDILALIQPNAAQLKFERDFNSNPNSGNRVSERPVPSQNQFLYPPGFSGEKKIPNDRFDKLFKPIVDNVNEDYAFNQYQFGKGSNDMNKRMEQLTAERDGETRMNGRPSTPEFLKPMKTQPEKNSYDGGQNMNSNRGSRTIQDIPKRNGRPDFTKDIPQDELDMGFLSANNDNGDLYNINNIDKPIDLREIEEDGRSFQERLKNLERERSSVNIPPNKGRIDFTSENFGNSQMSQRDRELDEIPDYEPKTVEQIREEKEMMAMKKRQEMREQFESNRKVQFNENINNQIPVRNNEFKPSISQQIAKSIPNKNLDINRIQNTLKKLGMVESSEVEHIKKENEMLKTQLRQFNSGKMDTVKQEIATEFEKLNEREIVVSKKEEEMKLLMKKYHYLYNTNNIQLDISPPESKSEFSFEFGPVENIVGMKLMSYSMPQARYNIENGKNNVFRIKTSENEMFELKLNSGKYTIENLIEKLNTKSEKYKFELNVEQIVQITAEEEFEIISSPLSKEVLGFTSNCLGSNEYIADKPWDLRIEEKVFLFINNIDDSTPFAVLYNSNQGNYQFKFEEPIKLDKLELIFKDSKGRQYNFYGLNYSLNIQLEINNTIGEIEL
jgi:hypothetical protein